MRSRIDILKDIMEIEKQYALGKVDSDDFENKMQMYEKQLHLTTALTNEEFLTAVQSKEIPLSAESLMGKITIEDLLPTFNVPRTFYRHLKIRREIRELNRNIDNLNHNLQKMRILIAEKKVNLDAAAVKVETLEFDLRLAENRLGAREKYLKRNPSKGELIKFTLENYLKFSYGHGVANEIELKRLADDLNTEIELRKEYRQAMAEMFATIKTSQLDISTSNQRNGLPDFKALREYQQMINEMNDYIQLLSGDIKDYCGCIGLLQKDILEMDESHDLYDPVEFDVSVTSTTVTDSNEDISPLIQSLEFGQNIEDPIQMFLIDTTDSSIALIEEEPVIQDAVPMENFVIPDTPQPVFTPDVDLEIVGGMEDFNSLFEINGTATKINRSTKKIIFKSFEGLLEKLIDKETLQGEEVVPVIPKQKVKFTPLKSDIEKSEKVGEIIEDQIIDSAEIVSGDSLDSLTEDMVISDELLPPKPEDIDTSTLPPPPPPTDDLVQPSVPIPPPPEDSTETLPPPPPPPPKDTPEREIDELTSEMIVDEPAVVETEELKPPEPTETIPKPELIKPKKASMISPKLMEASTEAWKLAGKAIFNLIDDNKRDFIGYIQEVVVFDKNRLGFILVTESMANQAIIDKIFDQIKPLWVTEDLLESAEKRKDFVIREVMESLQVAKDVALHITNLQEFSNFRNINFPEETQTSPPQSIGIVPIDKIRIKRGSIICSPDSIIALKPYRTAPWDGEFATEEKSPIGKVCYLSKGQKVGTIIAIVEHPLLGKILLLNAGVPDKSLVDYFVNRLDIKEQSPKERLWLLKYLIAKQLRIPEGEALQPKTLINYSLHRGFPILPNEILNSFRAFISGGSIEKTSKNKIILKNASRVFHPSEIFPLDCLRVREMSGRHVGTCLGISLSDNPVMLVSEKLSREIAVLFTNATTEKEVMNDIAQSVMGTIGVDFTESLCIHNILKSLIVGKKVQSLQDYGRFLTQMNVTGIH